MFGPLGIPEVLFILAVALLVFGPKRLPQAGRTLGKAMGEFRRASNDLRRTLNTEIALEEEKEVEKKAEPAPPTLEPTASGEAPSLRSPSAQQEMARRREAHRSEVEDRTGFDSDEPASDEPTSDEPASDET